MERFEDRIPLESAEQQETERVRRRNRIAKCASRARQRQQLEQANVDINSLELPASQEQAQDPEIGPMSSMQGRYAGPSTHLLEAPSREMNSAPPLHQHQAKSEIPFWDSTSNFHWGEFRDEYMLPVFQDVHMGMQKTQQICVPRGWKREDSLNSSQAATPGIISHGRPASIFLEHSSPILPEETTASTTMSDGSINTSSRLLHIAVRNGTMGILLSLMKAGADVNAQDPSGMTPIHLAVQSQRGKILEVLINHEANINARNASNMTALELAVRAQNEEIVNILLAGGAELS